MTWTSASPHEGSQQDKVKDANCLVGTCTTCRQATVGPLDHQKIMRQLNLFLVIYSSKPSQIVFVE